jgi:hypothetical protein
MEPTVSHVRTNRKFVNFIAQFGVVRGMGVKRRIQKLALTLSTKGLDTLLAGAGFVIAVSKTSKDQSGVAPNRFNDRPLRVMTCRT